VTYRNQWVSGGVSEQSEHFPLSPFKRGGLRRKKDEFDGNATLEIVGEDALVASREYLASLGAF